MPYTCPTCHRVSYHPMDEAQRFCAVCGFEADRVSPPLPIAPGYWMNETSGVLRPAIEAYLHGVQMTGEQIAAVRAYLRQWIAGDFIGADIERLRTDVDNLTTRAAISEWLKRAYILNIDPL